PSSAAAADDLELASATRDSLTATSTSTPHDTKVTGGSRTDPAQQRPAKASRGTRRASNLPKPPRPTQPADGSRASAPPLPQPPQDAAPTNDPAPRAAALTVEYDDDIEVIDFSDIQPSSRAAPATTAASADAGTSRDRRRPPLGSLAETVPPLTAWGSSVPSQVPRARNRKQSAPAVSRFGGNAHAAAQFTPIPSATSGASTSTAQQHPPDPRVLQREFLASISSSTPPPARQAQHQHQHPASQKSR
ncbi:hypothetical protein HK405_001551, partial [Cladochytrium tenue]